MESCTGQEAHGVVGAGRRWRRWRWKGAMRDRNRILLLFLLFLLFSLSKVTTPDTDHFQGEIFIMGKITNPVCFFDVVVDGKNGLGFSAFCSRSCRILN